MKSRNIAVTTLLAVVLAGQPVLAQPAFTGKNPSDQKQLMKSWALSTCFALIAKDQETKSDASSTAAAFLENSQQDLEDFDKIGALVESFVAKKYGGSVKSEYDTMKCIDMLHSKELDRLTSRLVKKRG